MRHRLAAIVLASLAAVTLGACGDSSGDIAVKKSGDTTLPADPADAVPGDDLTSMPDSGDVSDIPSLDDIPEMSGTLDDCMEASAIYSSMLAGLTGSELSADDQAKIDELQSSLPEDIRDDFEIIIDAMSKIGSEGIVAAGQAMSTPEFTAAQKNVEAYFTEACSDVRPGG